MKESKKYYLLVVFKSYQELNYLEIKIIYVALKTKKQYEEHKQLWRVKTQSFAEDHYGVMLGFMLQLSEPK